MGGIREAKELGYTQWCGGTGVPLKGTGPARKTNIRSILWPVGLSFLSAEARKIQWDPSLPGFLRTEAERATGLAQSVLAGWGVLLGLGGLYLLSFWGEEVFLFPKPGAQGARDQNRGGGDWGL